jgi:hypothetical protein
MAKPKPNQGMPDHAQQDRDHQERDQYHKNNANHFPHHGHWESGFAIPDNPPQNAKYDD